MKENNDFIKILLKRRKILGANHTQFADFIGLKEQSLLAKWETGSLIPSLSMRNKILRLPDEFPFKNTSSSHKLSFIDLFSGIGGIRLPFQGLGGKCVFSSEWDKFSKLTYASNFGEIPHGDITKINASNIPPHDILIAGFPCQAFSQAGLRQGFMDTRGTMFFEIQRILSEHQPKAFLLENVKQLRGHDKGRTLKTILKILSGENQNLISENVPMSEDARKSLSQKLNYEVDFRVLSSNNFGVPQKRERVYIVGFNRDKIKATNEVPKKIFDDLEKIKGVTRLGDILEENSNVDDRFTISDRLWTGHQRRKLEHKLKGNGFGYSIFNRDSKYCNTISARYYKDGSEILIDQTDILKNPRKLTPRECARIQGFPEDFVIDSVSDAQSFRQFGNSVSVPVIKAIAEEMIKYLNKHSPLI